MALSLSVDRLAVRCYVVYYTRVVVLSCLLGGIYLLLRFFCHRPPYFHLKYHEKGPYGEIDHQNDVWHLSKWVIKKLSQKAKVKGCEDLLPWIRSLSNHMWWCSATCDGNAQVLKEKSVLFHVTNKHKWNGYTYFHECCHPRLTSAQIRKKKWLKPDTPAYIALEEVVLNKKIDLQRH